MAEQTTLPHGVMEGKGAYNKYATIPHAGAALAAPFLEEAVRKIALDPDDRPVMIADYGSSQGKNSLAPIQIALRNLRPRIGPDRAVFVFHIDQPSNDFNSLFEVLSSDPDRYALRDSQVFPCAIGRSFYEQVLPAKSVHLAWSSYAAVWLSHIPSLIPGHFIPLRSTGAVGAAFASQAAGDWESFLALRAQELRPGGRLVVALPGRVDGGGTGFEEVMDHANAALGEMVEDGEIQAEERERMVLGTYPRLKSELLAPFHLNGQFRDLRVEHCEVSVLPDAAWLDYEHDRDGKVLGTKRALFFRSVFMPSLASALTLVRAGDNEALGVFADRLQQRMIRRMAGNPARINTFVQTIVLAKCD
jgi:hypothetical protein